MSTLTLRPTSDGTYADWTKSTGTAGWDLVDDTGTGDSDTTYIKRTTSGTAYSTFGIDHADIDTYIGATDPISSVEVFIRVKDTDTGLNGNNFWPVLYLGSTLEEGYGEFASNNNYTQYNQVIGKPGGGSWTRTNIHNLQIGIGGVRDWAQLNCTQIYCVVTYTAGGGGPTYTLTAAQGSFTLTGRNNAFKASRQLPITPNASFSLTGRDVTFTYVRHLNLVADTGSFTLSGNENNLVKGPFGAASSLFPVADVVNQWTKSTGATGWSVVDEDYASPNDADYIYSTSNGQISSFSLDPLVIDTYHSQLTVGSNLLVLKVRYRSNDYSNAGTFRAFVKIGGTTVNSGDYTSNAQYPVSWQTATISFARPGGGTWTRADLYSLVFGVENRTAGYGTQVSVCHVLLNWTAAGEWITTYRSVPVEYGEGVASVKEIPVEYGEGVTSSRQIPTEYTIRSSLSGCGHPSGLLADRQTNPTSLSEYPIFSAVHNIGEVLTGSATKYQLQIAANPTFSSTVWDSGLTAMTSTADGARCPNIKYTGSAVLSNAYPYYWRIRFADNSNNYSLWSDGDAVTYGTTMSGFIREWADTDYTFRKKIEFNDNHPEIPVGYTASVNFQTGYRRIIARNAFFNDGTSEQGYQIAYYDNKSHVVYLSATDLAENTLSIYIISYDWVTDSWGEPVYLGDAATTSDTHYYPTLTIDTDGYIYVFYGCHYTELHFRRSSTPNVTGSLPDEPVAWEAEYIFTGTMATYPIPFVVTSNNRVYVMYRAGAGPDSPSYCFHYSDNRGATWSSAYYCVYDHNADRYRAYCHGARFDPRNNRIHLGITFNSTTPVDDTEMGVWYCYADYDGGQTEGYHTWYWVDGTQAGTTCTTLTGHTGGTTSDPVTRNASKAIITRTSYNIQFIECVVPLADRSVIVVWEERLFWEPLTGETCLACAKWNGSSWVITKISEQTGIKLRVRRNGGVGLADKDNVIRLAVPVDSKTYQYLVPTSDVQSSGVTRSTGDINYGVVDDGIQYFNTDYISLAASTGVASFTTSQTLSFDPSKTILGVKLSAVCRGYVFEGSSSGTVQLFLKIAGTEYVQSCGSYNDTITHFSYSWATNPNSTSAWTQSAVEALEFGIKNPTANNALRCSRLCLEVLVMSSSDEEWFNSEIYEFSSDDDGVTWIATRMSENSAVGVPMLSVKTDLSNDRIEYIWSSGNDLFYTNNVQRYGRVQPSARDLRLYYGTTEIDRLIDYANCLETTILFKVQEAIAANLLTGPKDYYLYYGNKSATANALSDPHNVYTYFENFETYSTFPTGTGGWTIRSGSASLYSSPPNHNSCVYAGEKSLRSSTSAVFDADRTLGSALTDLYVEYSIYHNAGAGVNTYVKLLDASNNFFGLGAPTDSLHPQYTNGSTWYNADGSSGRPHAHAADFIWYKYGVQVNADGCTGYFDWQQRRIGTNVTGITSVDKMRLHSDDSSYFDFIKVSKRLERRGTTTVTTFTDGAGTVDSVHTYPYLAASDIKHEFTQPRISKIDLTVRARSTVTATSSPVLLHFRVGNTQTYDGTFLDRNFSGSAQGGVIYTGTGVNTWSSKIFTFDVDLIQDTPATANNNQSYHYLHTIGRKSIKLDAYSSTASGVEIELVSAALSYASTADPELSLLSEETNGFYADATILGQGSQQFTMDARISSALVVSTGNFSLTGTSTGLKVSRKNVVDRGIFTLAGTNTGLATARHVPADLGSISLTPNDAGLVVTRQLPADSATFTAVGNETTLLYTRHLTLTADTVSFAVDGNATAISIGLIIIGDTGIFDITGSDLGFSIALPVPTGEFTVTTNDAGVEYTRHLSLTADSGSLSLVGPPTLLVVARDLVCDVGQFLFDGTESVLSASLQIISEVSEFLLTGNDTTFSISIPGQNREFVITGNDVGFLWNHVLGASTGEFTLVGYLIPTARLSADPTSFALTGNDINFVPNWAIVTDAGSFTVTGSTINLVYNRIFTVDASSIILSGTDTTLTSGRVLSADCGPFIVEGTDPSFYKHLTLETSTGVFAVSGSSVASVYVLRTSGASFHAVNLIRDYILIAEPAVYSPSCYCDEGQFIVEGRVATLQYTPTAPTNEDPPISPAATIDPDALPGGRVGRGPGGGGGYGNRSIDDIYTDRKLSQVRKKRATISKQDDEEIMTVISAFLRMVDDEEEA